MITFADWFVPVLREGMCWEQSHLKRAMITRHTRLQIREWGHT